MEKMPIVFVGHGNPMNIVLDNVFTQSLQKLRSQLPTPKAICVVSAHWQTVDTVVCCATEPKQIYDFYGFPDELYRVNYHCAGHPDLAQDTIKLLGGEKSGVACDNSWGHDHAGWSVLKHLYPKADIPVYLISVDMKASAAHHVELAKRLAPLREEGVLIMGSGNIVHNLFEVEMGNMEAPPTPEGVRFDEAVKKALIERDIDALVNFERWGKDARYSVPTPDHYLPLLWIAALRQPGDALTFPCEIFQNRSVSMRSVLIG